MAAADRIGSVIAGKYRLERLLGEGGMGAVYAATHVTVGKRFAVKVLHADTSKHPDAKRRFTQEAQAAARIGHPAILDVYDLGEDETSLYMVMDLLSGESLAERVHRGPLPITEALEYAVGVLAALEAAHDVGVIHRDIKPANVYVVDDKSEGRERVRVLDFGIAKFQEPADGAKTSTGAVLGSAYYMAPEQVRAESEIDARADIWAVGATLYELLVGEPAHAAPTHAAVVAKIVLTPAPAVTTKRPEVDAKTSAAVARALRIDPAERFPTAAAMREVLETCLVERAATIISVPPPSLSPSAKARRASGETPRVMIAETDLSPLTDDKSTKNSMLPLIAGALAIGVVSTLAVFAARRSATNTDPSAAAPSSTPVATPAVSPTTEPASASASPSASPSASASASPSASASASPSASASASPSPSASARRLLPSALALPPPPAPRPSTCATGEVLSNGHCCVSGFVWREGHCERDIAVTPPF